MQTEAEKYQGLREGVGVAGVDERWRCRWSGGWRSSERGWRVDGVAGRRRG